MIYNVLNQVDYWWRSNVPRFVYDSDKHPRLFAIHTISLTEWLTNTRAAYGSYRRWLQDTKFDREIRRL